MVWPNGKKVEKFDKKILISSFTDFNVANVQLEPLGLWGYDYNSGKGLRYSEQIDDLILKIPSPFILCGDFSGDFTDDKVWNVLKKSFAKFELKDALPDKITRPLKSGSGRKTDHIYYTSPFKLIKSDIVDTQTDHLLCWADFEF